MTTTYGRSAMGYLWAVIEPVAAVGLLSVVFSIAFRSPPLGSNFPLFYASGYLVFFAYTSVSNKIATAIRFSRPLLEFPAVRVLDAILARFLLNMLTQLMVFYLVMSGIILIFGLRLILVPEAIALSFAMASALALGIGTLNCFLFTAFPSYEYVWSIVNRPLFIISGVLFLFDDVPAFWRNILWWNPFAHLIGEMRAGFYGTYEASYVSPAYVFAVALICLTLGLLLIRRFLHRVMRA
jgi:capsular polysaccharide transport system permease protein